MLGVASGHQRVVQGRCQLPAVPVQQLLLLVLVRVGPMAQECRKLCWTDWWTNCWRSKLNLLEYALTMLTVCSILLACCCSCTYLFLILLVVIPVLPLLTHTHTATLSSLHTAFICYYNHWLLRIAFYRSDEKNLAYLPDFIERSVYKTLYALTLCALDRVTQDMRKTAGFDVSDRIELHVAGHLDSNWRKWLAESALAEYGAVGVPEAERAVEVAGRSFRIRMRRSR